MRANAGYPRATDPGSSERRYRLVAIDVDGTLVDRGKPIAPPVIRAIEQAQRQGARVTLASGRMFPLVEALVKQLALTAPIICYGGALIVDPASRTALYQRGVPLVLVQEVIQAARARSLLVRAYVGEEVYVDRIDPAAYNYDSLRRVNAIAVGDLVDYLSKDPSHLAIDSPAALTRSVVGEMRRLFQGRLNVTTGHPLLTEFSLPDVHKGSALLWLCRHLRIDPEDALAIGDDWNDIEMLRSAGLGAAVANANPDVLAIADVVVPSVMADGVAVAIERFVLT